MHCFYQAHIEVQFCTLAYSQDIYVSLRVRKTLSISSKLETKIPTVTETDKYVTIT